MTPTPLLLLSGTFLLFPQFPQTLLSSSLVKTQSPKNLRRFIWCACNRFR
jgi:hypothetical protein